jgi:hypothetical protein
MSRDGCERELEVMAAIDADAWPADLEAHVASCDACRQVRAIGGALLGYAREEADEPLPDASSLWWRARLDARREARRRSMLPLDTIDRAEPFVAIVVVALVLLLRGDVVMRAFTTWLAGSGAGPVMEMAVPGLVMPVLVGGLVVTALMLLVGLGAAFARD